MTLLNHFVSQNNPIFYIASFLADFIVLIFPIILIYLTLWGWNKNDWRLQKDALLIFWSSIIAIVINLIIQSFIMKDRPETLPGLDLILKHLPTMSFPSDHAAVSMAFSGCFLLLCNKLGKSYHIIWTILLIGSIVMGICRTAVAVHRPTDILAWWIIGLCSAYMVYILKNNSIINELIDFIVGVENKILNYLFIRYK